ncbi:hypothetical protein Ancab_001166, partial [Ancistrocladus abbreviatus]
CLINNKIDVYNYRARLSFVIERITNLLSEEIKFLVGVEDQVNGLPKELTWMRSYLKDAKAKQEESNEVDRVTFREITRTMYDAEDVVESFILKPSTTMRRKESFFKKYICTCCSTLYTHQVSTEVEAIKKRIKETEEMLQRYCQTSITSIISYKYTKIIKQYKNSSNSYG